MGQQSVSDTTLRERALSALDAHRTAMTAEEEQRERANRERDLEYLRRDIATYLGIDASDAPVEWGPWGYGDREAPRVVIDGIRFQRNDGPGRLMALINRDGCDHEERAYISDSGPAAWVALGGAVYAAAQVECRRCADPGVPDESVATPSAPSLGERLVELVREVVRDELRWQGEV